MKTVDKYIQTLLFEHDYVTVPTFGAFIANYVPATYSEKSGSLTPPQRKIAFNEVLKYDDGLLATYIARREKISVEDAQKHIQAFIEEIKGELFIEKQAVLSKIGIFSLNQENNLVFEPDNKHNFYSESFGLENIYARKRSKEQKIEMPFVATTVDELAMSENKTVSEVHTEIPAFEAESVSTSEIPFYVSPPVMELPNFISEENLAEVTPTPIYTLGNQEIIPARTSRLSAYSLYALPVLGLITVGLLYFGFSSGREDKTTESKKVAVSTAHNPSLSSFNPLDYLPSSDKAEVKATTFITHAGEIPLGELPAETETIQAEEVHPAEVTAKTSEPVTKPIDGWGDTKKETTKTKSVAEKKVEPLVAMPVATKIIAVKETPKKEVIAEISEGKYKVVAGMFKSDNNARRLKKRLSANGFNHVRLVSRFNENLQVNLISVIVAEVNDKDEAQKIASSVEELVGEKAIVK